MVGLARTSRVNRLTSAPLWLREPSFRLLAKIVIYERGGLTATTIAALHESVIGTKRTSGV
jgi:hypothetical protein